MAVVSGKLFVARASLSGTNAAQEYLMLYDAATLAPIDSLQLGRGLHEIYPLPNNTLVLSYAGELGSNTQAPFVIFLNCDRPDLYTKLAIPSGGQAPRRFTLSPDGRYLACLATGGIKIIDLSLLDGWVPIPFKQTANLSSLAFLPTKTALGGYTLWVADARDYASAGTLFALKMPSFISGQYTVEDRATVGVIPGQILYF